MDNGKFFETVVRMDTTLEHLVPAVQELTKEVRSLQQKQNYWSGAIAAVGVGSSVAGAFVALVFQWLTKSH